MLVTDWMHYEKRYWYPHMSPADTLIWERYIAANPEAFDLVAYDVAIGAGAPFDTMVSPDTEGDMGRVYQRRIDVLARIGMTTYVIELKPRASTSAIGQVIGYKALLERDHPEFKGAKPVLITNEILPEMQFLADAAGVEIRVA